MKPRDRTPGVVWAVLGILVGTSALAVVAAYTSASLAPGIALGGVATALLLAWAAQPAPSSGEKTLRPGHDQEGLSDERPPATARTA